MVQRDFFSEEPKADDDRYQSSGQGGDDQTNAKREKIPKGEEECTV